MTSRCLLTDAGSSQHPVPSSSSGSRKVPVIFLSHSGKQKPFVERLNDALRRVNHSPFFDVHSLRKGDPFPEEIKYSARECKLGVVVLTEDFVTSKWPMIELEILVRQRGPNAKLLPLFYKLAPKDLKSSEKLVEWRKKWEEMNSREGEEMTDQEKENTKRKVDEWDQALKALRRLDGEIYVQGTSEGQYIKRVVKSICMQVPCPLPHDMSGIAGHERLAQEVVRRFDRVCHDGQDGGACMVGLHGVGGMGKSSLCKIMANYYSSEYPGKSHHLELPTDGYDINMQIKKCKQALRVIANLDDTFLKKAQDIDQVIALMKEHLTEQDIFLAIDNVWESSREIARKIMKVGFSSKSKVLVTSRSEQLLKELCRDLKNSIVGPLPSPEYEEASQILQEALELADLNSLARGRQFVDCALGRCRFDGTYHALALKALGMHVKNMCPLGGWQHVKEDVLSSIQERIRIADLTKVDDVIRLTYDNLPKHMQHVFLDIAFLPTMRNYHGQLTYERACRWLSCLYENQSSEAMIKELCLGGLLQLETDGYTGATVIRVHDLLSSMAKRKVAIDTRFFIAGLSKMELQWQELERMVLGFPHVKASSFVVRSLLRQECRRLQVLDVRQAGIVRRIDMRLMPALRGLRLRDVTVGSIENWSASALAIVELDNVHFLQGMLDRSSMRVLSLKGVAQLQTLHMMHLNTVEETESLDILTMLQSLHVEDCNCLKRIPDLSSLTRLDTLRLWNNSLMEVVDGLSSTLRDVEIRGCKALQRVPDVSGLARLETLTISECTFLKRILDLSALTRLDTLDLSQIQLMEEIRGLSSSLRRARFDKCQALERVVDISGLTRLETLSIHECGVLRKIPDLSGLTCLETLSIYTCGALREIPDLSNLTCLDKLQLRWNESMEVVGGLSSNLRRVEIDLSSALERLPDMSGLTALESLWIGNCGNLKRIPGLSIPTGVVELTLGFNISIEGVGGFSPSLKTLVFESCNNALGRELDMNGLTRLEALHIRRCAGLKRIPDLSSLTCLRWLELWHNEEMEEVCILSSSLRNLQIRECSALKTVTDMSGLTRLETLSIVYCQALKRIPDLGGLIRLDDLTLRELSSVEQVDGWSANLSQVYIMRCTTLKKVPDMSGLTRLEMLTLFDNEAVEEVEGESVSSTLSDLYIGRCPRLTRFPRRFETLCPSLRFKSSPQFL